MRKWTGDGEKVREHELLGGSDAIRNRIHFHEMNNQEILLETK